MSTNTTQPTKTNIHLYFNEYNTTQPTTTNIHLYFNEYKHNTTYNNEHTLILQ